MAPEFGAEVFGRDPANRFEMMAPTRKGLIPAATPGAACRAPQLLSSGRSSLVLWQWLIPVQELPNLRNDEGAIVFR
jgi:hypothetical protein